MIIKFRDVTKNKEWKFDNIKSLLSFCEKEKKFWDENKEKINDRNLSSYFNIGNFFNQIITKLNSIKELEDEQQINQGITQLQSNYFNKLNSSFIWSGHSFVSTWIESYHISTETGNAFVEAILQKRSQDNQNFNSMKGYILAYEFELQDESILTKRRNAEKKSIGQLRTQLEDKTNSLIKEVDEFESDFNEWSEETKNYTQRLSKVKKKLFSRSQKQKQKEFDKFMDTSKSNIEELENTYQEKLRLEKPATYWNKKAGDYKTQGIIWSIVFVVVLGIGIYNFSSFFSLWLKGEQLGLELKSLQGAVIFMTIITIYAILIKSISKMVFSSFHLQRDAEEREQLTHVYLSLTNEDGNIDEESRKIVLQALFSRADSGLLHKDSSPTMPGLHELVKATGGK